LTDRNDEQRTIAPDGRPADQQPAWRTEFPIDTPEEQYVARREFTKFLGLASLGFAVGQVWILVQNWLGRRQMASPPRQFVARQEEIPVGGALTFTYPDDAESCLLLRPAAETFVAFHQKCTHLSCAVTPDAQRQCLFCPCHHGLFDLTTGRPIAGPPRRPLPRIHLEIADGAIYAVGVEHRTV
jgi:Rieske Fe-S protein